eukprot:Lithocolla_globosa_v1_NODE_2994_length_1802_cov_12.540927.p2 type:complete len:106 gc:universal NODE_2994_length_1802_cov_12.540927:756-1073(+)
MKFLILIWQKQIGWETSWKLINQQTQCFTQPHQKKTKMALINQKFLRSWTCKTVYLTNLALMYLRVFMILLAVVLSDSYLSLSVYLLSIYLTLIFFSLLVDLFDP